MLQGSQKLGHTLPLCLMSPASCTAGVQLRRFKTPYLKKSFSLKASWMRCTAS